MAKVFKAIGTVAAIASLVLPPPYNMIAQGVSLAASIGAKATAKKPGAVGQATGFMVGANNPLPYLIGEAYTEGVEIYREGYGGKVGKTQNPYGFIPRVLSCCGPIEDMGTTLVDHEAITLTGSVGSVQGVASGGYYEGFLFVDQQLGARPESSALAVPAGWGTPTGWGSAYKLSGMAALAWSLLWDKDGQVFGGGQIPPLGKLPKGVWVYDPRLDSTYPGGSGPCRLGDESTYVYSRCPALHSGTYAHGRTVNGEPVFGCRLFEQEAVNWARVVAWANVCDANAWAANGTIYEPADKWNNLKTIAEAGAGQPVLRGGLVDFDYQAPRTPLASVGLDDLAPGAVSARLGSGWKERVNTLVGRYRSPDHKWTYQQAEAVVVSAFLVEDGEEKSDERQWDLVTNVDQLTELAIYDLWQRREGGPFRLPCKPHMRFYGPGDCLTLLAELGVHPDGDVKAVVVERNVDLATGIVELVFTQETDAKHVAALGTTGAAPGVASQPTGQDIDDTWAANTAPVLKLENETDGDTAEITDYDTWVEIARKTGKAPGGGVLVWANAALTVLDNCEYKARILRDGVQVGIISGPISVAQDNQVEMTFSRSDEPTAGTECTWTVEVQTNNRGIAVNDPQIQIFLKS